MSDDGPPFPPCHSYSDSTTHSPPCRCCSDHRRRIRQLLAELNAMRSTAAKSTAIITEPSWTFSCEEDHKLKEEQEPKISKEEAEANAYTIIKVARDEDLREQIGKNTYFDLVDTDKIGSFRILKHLPFAYFKAEVAKIYGIPVQYQRYWFWVEHRPIYTLMPCQEIETVAALEVLKGAGSYLFLEAELGRDLIPLPPPTISRGDILIFFKLYEPAKMNIRYVGRMFVKAVGMPLEILSKLNGLAGFSENEEIEPFEELEYKTDVLCKPIDKRISFKDSKLEDGGIICFQKATISESKTNYRYPDIPSFLEYVHSSQVVHFRPLKEPKEEEFCLELSKLHTYDDVVERVANHLGLDNPSKIRLTAHDRTWEQPKCQPIGYRGFKRLSDVLMDCNKTSDILYYEVLPIPLPQMRRSSILKAIFHHSTKDEAVGHHIILPIDSCVGDVINELKSKPTTSPPSLPRIRSKMPVSAEKKELEMPEKEALKMPGGEQRLDMCSWQNLPDDVLYSITRKIYTVEDYLKFSGVCRDFRNASAQRPLTMPSQHPFLMVPYPTMPKISQGRQDDGVRYFYDLEDSKLIKMDIPEIAGTRCHAAYCGWLLLQSLSNNELYLLNPITHVKVSLPSFSVPVHYMSFGEQQAGEQPEVCIHLENSEAEKITNTSFYGNPMDPNCFVLLIRRNALVFLGRRGDQRWTWVNGANGIAQSHFQDVAYSNDKLYFLYKTALVVGDINNPSDAARFEWQTSKPKANKHFINGLSGMFVLTVSDIKTSVRKDALGNLPQTDMSEAVKEGRACELEVHQLLEHPLRLRQVNDTSEVSLFLGDDLSCFGMSTERQQSSIPRGSILVPFFRRIQGSGSVKHSIHFADLVEGIFRALRNDLRGEATVGCHSPALWFQPSF